MTDNAGDYRLGGHPSLGVVRDERAILVDVADLMVRQLAVSEHILAALRERAVPVSNHVTGEPKEQRSSVEIKTSTRGVDVTSKAYDGSDVAGLVGPAVDAYFRTLELVQQRLDGGKAS